MKNYTAEQLKSLSREELIEEILKQQTEYNVLLANKTGNTWDSLRQVPAAEP